VVEQLTVNQLVVGSTPTVGAKIKSFVPLVKQLSKWCPGCPQRHKTIKGLWYEGQ